MADVKIHIPGEPKDGVQRCVRCHARIDFRLCPAGWPLSQWLPGSPVASDGRGNMTVEIPTTARECGRKAA